MTITDRLDQTEQRAASATALTLGDDNARECYNVVADDVPALLAALRAVLDRHPKGCASVIEYTAAGTVEHCLGCRGAHGIAHDEFGLVPWPCPTVTVITAALGEDA